MKTQLLRQLELNLNAISRSFRQALRHATKVDPQGTAETSPAWRAVAARQAMLTTMLAAAGQFLQPQPAEAPAPEPETAMVAATPETEVPEQDDTDSEVPGQPELEEMSRGIAELREQLIAVTQWPTDTVRQRNRQSQELHRLKAALDRRVKRLAELMPALTASG